MTTMEPAFSSLESPRVEHNKKLQLLYIIFMTICALISGAEGWESIESFGQEKIDWLKKLIALENWIPSRDMKAGAGLLEAKNINKR